MTTPNDAFQGQGKCKQTMKQYAAKVHKKARFDSHCDLRKEDFMIMSHVLTVF